MRSITQNGPVLTVSSPENQSVKVSEFVGKSIKLPTPFATVERPTVQQHKWWAGAGLPVGDLQPSDLDLVRGGLPLSFVARG
jgi:hypothetical protein